MKTKSQRFAEVVFPNVAAVANQEYRDKYKTLSKKAGSLVRNSGLVQALAFFKARQQRAGEGHHGVLVEHLEGEMRTLGLLADQSLYETAVSAPVPKYMVLTREVLFLLNWHKRLAETLIIKDKDEDKNMEGR